MGEKGRPGRQAGRQAGGRWVGRLVGSPVCMIMGACLLIFCMCTDLYQGIQPRLQLVLVAAFGEQAGG